MKVIFVFIVFLFTVFETTAQKNVVVFGWDDTTTLSQDASFKVKRDNEITTKGKLTALSDSSLLIGQDTVLIREIISISEFSTKTQNSYTLLGLGTSLIAFGGMMVAYASNSSETGAYYYVQLLAGVFVGGVSALTGLVLNVVGAMQSPELYFHQSRGDVLLVQ